jgi:aspartate racemase
MRMRKKIGIITGSGPEAGVDLWQKILQANKNILKEQFKGDLDAPDVTILSVPQLGYSMELEKNYDKVWDTLQTAVKDICQRVDYFVIACNTLNLYANEIEAIGYKDKFISTLDVVEAYIQEHQLNKVCIIGALPVLQMQEYSVFQPLAERFNVEVPLDFNQVHQLIYDVKQHGGDSVTEEFKAILKSIESEHIFLACTELPLIPVKCEKKNLIDVTNLLAQTLVKKTF